MKNIRRTICNRNAYVQTDLMIFVIVFSFALVTLVNVVNILMIRSNLDNFTKEMAKCAAINGCIDNVNIDDRYADLVTELGFEPETLDFSASETMPASDNVQYADTIRVTSTFTTNLKGFDAVDIPIEMKFNYSELSMKYWK